jgi:hypothetical protein
MLDGSGSGGRQGAASEDKPDLPTIRLGLPAYPAQRHRVRRRTEPRRTMSQETISTG